ncbi:uncharacterized protein LOC128230097 isoform X2 [Mya arenaria]|uniref:uncharacterized protein LOC128230097 isoform X2 n=1 Tax=Mya arenaria TaxID=6604 RepID=UPI0022E8CADA|nr:uncharacterized protein LOC128230097 isoform X2 [Mya arenaria]
MFTMAESIEARRENWLRVVWGLLYVREGLQGYVDTKSEQQYQAFKKNVIGKCNNQTCDKCQFNSKCPNGMTKKTGKSPFRPGHFCDEMNKEVQNNHVKYTPFLVNTDSTKWLDPQLGHWEVTKCYLSTSGYMDKTGPNHVDASGLLSICINSSFIKQHISNIQQFEEVRNIRNKTLHDANYEFDRQTAEDCLDKMIAVLLDPQELVYNTSAKDAADHIRTIKETSSKIPEFISKALGKSLQTNFEVESALKQIEEQMCVRLRKELKEELTHYINAEMKHKLADANEEGRRYFDRVEDQEAKLRGEAGMGKTSFSQYLALAWCAVHGDSEECVRMREKIKTFKHFNDIDYLKQTQLLFLLHLREFENESECKTMLSSYLHLKLGFSVRDASELIAVINNPNAIVLIDGLDEWKCSTKEMPEFNCLYRTNILCTSRPWKIDYCVTAPTQTYNKITISGIGFDFVKRLVINVTDCLRKESIDVRDNVTEFIKTLRSTELRTIISLNASKSDELLMIPVVIIQLLCLWHDEKDFGSTRTQIYINMAETLLRRMKNQSEPYKAKTCKVQMFKTMKAKCCIEQSENIAKLSKLAFYLLFTGPAEHSLQFSKKDLSSLNMSDGKNQEIKKMFKEIKQFCLNSGFIHGTARKSSSSQDKLYRFIHKSYQEFFAALHIVAQNCDKNTCQEISANIQTLQNVVELANVFDFVCSSDSTCVEPMVSLIDDLTSKHGQQADNVMRINVIKTIQDMIFDSCSKYVNQGNMPIKLSNLIVQGLDLRTVLICDRLIKIQKNNENKIQTRDMEIILNKKVGVLFIANFSLLSNIDLSPFDMEELILLEVGTSFVSLRKIQRLKWLQLCLNEPSTVSIPFQDAENLTYLEMKNCSLSGPLDLSQCPLLTLKLYNVKTKKLVLGFVETCQVECMDCSFEFMNAKQLTNLSMISCSLSSTLDLSQCPLNGLKLFKVQTKKVVAKCVKTCTVENMDCSFKFTNAIKLTKLRMKECSLPGSLDLSQCQLEELTLYKVQTKKVTIGFVKTCMVEHINCSMVFTNATQLTYLSMISCDLPSPLDLSQCPLLNLRLYNVQTIKVVIGCVETCEIELMDCSFEFKNAIQMTNLSMMSCSLPVQLDLSHCPLETLMMRNCSLSGPLDLSKTPLVKLKLYNVQTKKVVTCDVKICMVNQMDCSFEFTNAIKLTNLSMTLCSLPGQLDLSQCPLKELKLSKVQAKNVIIGCCETCVVENMDCSFDFTRAIKLCTLKMMDCSLQGQLDLSHCPLEELKLNNIQTRKGDTGCVETGIDEQRDCSLEFTKAIKLKNLSLMSCSLPGQLDLSRYPLKVLKLYKVQTIKVDIGCVETCMVEHMDCSFDFLNAIKLTNLSVMSCSIPSQLDLSKCPLEKLELYAVNTKKVVMGRVETCTIQHMNCLFDFTNAMNLTNLRMISCSLPGPVDLSHCPLKELILDHITTIKAVAACVEKLSMQDINMTFELTNSIKLSNLSMISCSFPGTLDLSQCPLKELKLDKVKTKKLIIGCMETCTLEKIDCLYEYTNAFKLTTLRIMSCSLPGPLDLSQCRLVELKLSNVLTKKVVIGCVETCMVERMKCSFEFTNATKLSNLSMISCSLSGPLDLSKCPLEVLKLYNVQTNKLVTCCVKRCTVKNMECSVEFTNATNLTNLRMMSCSFSGPLDLSRCPLKNLKLNLIKTDKVVAGCIEKCTLQHMEFSFQFTNEIKVTNLRIMDCVLLCPLDLSQCQLEELKLDKVKTEKVIIGCMETCSIENMHCSFEFANAIKINNLSMISCSLPGPLDLSQCQLVGLNLDKVKTTKVITGFVETCNVENMDCSFELTNALHLTNLSMISCSLPGPLDLSPFPLEKLKLYNVKTKLLVTCCVETCTLEHMDCSFDLTNAIKLTNLSMTSCSLRSPLNLSKCPLEKLRLDNVQTKKMVSGVMMKCIAMQLNSSFEFTNAIQLTYLFITSCSLPGPLDLSQCPLVELKLTHVQTKKVVTGCLEICIVEHVDCSFEFMDATKLTNLRMLSCSLPGPLDLSKFPLEVLKLSKIQTKKVVIGSLETCMLDHMECSLEFTNAKNLTNLLMISCSLFGPLDLSMCPLEVLKLFKVHTKKLVVGCVETCTVEYMDCLIEFTNAVNLAKLCMTSCNLPGSLDLSKCPLEELKLDKVQTKKVVTCCVDTCTIKNMDCSFEFKNATKLTELKMMDCCHSGPLDLSQCPLKKLDMKTCSLSGQLDLSQCPLNLLMLNGVRTVNVVIGCVEQLVVLDLNFPFRTRICISFLNANNLTRLSMTNCIIQGPLNLSKCPLKNLSLKVVDTDMVIVGWVEKCAFKNMSCSFQLTNQNTLIDLSFIDCFPTQPVNLSNCPFQFLELVKVDLSQFKLGSLETLKRLRISDGRLLSELPSSASNLVHVILEHNEIQNCIDYQPLTTLEIKETCGKMACIELSKTAIECLILHDPKMSPLLFEQQMEQLYSLPRKVTCSVRGSSRYWNKRDVGKKLIKAIQKMKNEGRFSVKETQDPMTFTIITRK